jgi:hypothetical protein
MFDDQLDDLVVLVAGGIHAGRQSLKNTGNLSDIIQFLRKLPISTRMDRQFPQNRNNFIFSIMMPPLLVFPTDMKLNPLPTIFVLGLSTGLLSATVTHVPATLANTDNAAGGVDSTWANGDDGTTGGTAADGTTTSNDSKWRYRGGFGVSGIWEATSSSTTPEDAVQITTSVAVPNGTYQVYVFFVPVEAGAESPVGSGVDNDFPIRAGNTSTTLELFDQLGPASGSTYSGYEVATVGKNALTGVDALTFTSAPNNQGTRPLLYGLLSTTQVVDDGILEVFIDDFPALGFGGNTDARTWYDGIGYERVPEPSITLLGALGSLMLLRRSRL